MRAFGITIARATYVSQTFVIIELKTLPLMCDGGECNRRFRFSALDARL